MEVIEVSIDPTILVGALLVRQIVGLTDFSELDRAIADEIVTARAS
jgi:hypothetical protein